MFRMCDHKEIFQMVTNDLNTKWKKNFFLFKMFLQEGVFSEMSELC